MEEILIQGRITTHLEHPQREALAMSGKQSKSEVCFPSEFASSDIMPCAKILHTILLGCLAGN